MKVKDVIITPEGVILRDFTNNDTIVETDSILVKMGVKEQQLSSGRILCNDVRNFKEILTHFLMTTR